MHGISPMPAHIHVAMRHTLSETPVACLCWRSDGVIFWWIPASLQLPPCRLSIEVFRSTSCDSQRPMHTGHQRQGEGRSQPDKGRREGRSRRSQGQGEDGMISSSDPAIAAAIICQFLPRAR